MKNAASLLSPAVLSVIACTSAAPPAPAPPPPDLTIASVHVVGTPQENTWTAQNPIQLQLGCSHNPVLIELNPKPDTNSSINGFQIAVPGGCSNTDACGWFVLRMDAGEADEISVPTRTSSITVDEVLEPGTHTISIELHDAYDRILLRDGTPIGEQVSLDFVAADACPAPDGDAG